MRTDNYLSPEETKLIALANKNNSIQTVNHYYWINTSNPDDKFAFIDTIELVFNNFQSLFFKVNDSDSGIEIIANYLYEDEKAILDQTFKGKISLKKVDASDFKFWKSVLKTSFVKIKTEIEKGNLVNTSLIIEFKTDKLEITCNEADGLVIDYYEDNLI